MLPQLTSGLFNGMAVITGQYYMSQINKSLGNVENSISDVLSFLDNDKRSELESEEEFLKITQRSLCYIMNNESQRQATLTTIQKIKIDSLSNIKFYIKQINNLKRIDTKKDKIEQVLENIKDIDYCICEYYYSLYLYCFSTFLEPILACNNDAEYLNLIKEDIGEKCNQYKKDYLLWEKKINEYIDTAKAFDNNKVLTVLKEIGKTRVKGNINIQFAQLLIEVISTKADEYDKNRKKGKKEDAYKLLTDNAINSDITVIEDFQDKLQLYSSLNNEKIELIVDHDQMYLKVPEE